MTLTESTTSLTAHRAPATPGRTRSRGRRIGLIWIALTAIPLAAVLVSQYATASLQSLASDEAGLASTYVNAPAVIQIALYVHIVMAGIALAIGPVQFSQRLRLRFTRAHRWAGRVYLVSVILGALASLVMLPFNNGGYAGFFGFGALAVLWIVTAWRAYRSIREGDVRAHQSWMIRNFAITYAAVTLRAWLGLLVVFHLFVVGGNPDTAIAEVYAVVPFIAWLPNIVIAEILVRRRGLPGWRWTS